MLLGTYAEGGAEGVVPLAPGCPRSRLRPPRRAKAAPTARPRRPLRPGPGDAGRSAGARLGARRLHARPSAPPISASRSCWSSAGRRSAASASMSAASRPRRCCTPPRWSTKPRRWARTASPSARRRSTRPAARLEGRRRQAADRRPLRPRQAAQGHGGDAATGASFRSTARGQTARGRQGGELRAGDHRGGVRAGRAGSSRTRSARLDSTGALEIALHAEAMLVLGGGIIGLEMATVYHALGARVTVVELMDQIIPGADKDIVTPLAKRIGKRYEAILLKTKVTKVEAKAGGLVAFEGADGPRPRHSTRCWWRSGAGRTARRSAPRMPGCAVDERGFIPSTSRCAPTCRTSSPSATSSASRCWRIRRRTRARSRPKSRAATSPPSTRK